MNQTPYGAVIALHGVSRHFGRFAALRGITAEFAAGRLYVIVGDNGAGKSTLLRILAGLRAPDAGVVTIAHAAPSLTPQQSSTPSG